MKETRKLYNWELRRLCIKHNWYTRGTNEEYSRLLSMVDELDEVGTAQIIWVAKDILAHSETDYPLSAICFEIAETCHSFFE